MPDEPRWAHRPQPAGPGGQARSPSGPALLEELNIEQGDTVARQKAEAGGAVNRSARFAMTKLQGSLICMCQGLLGKLFDPHGDL